MLKTRLWAISQAVMQQQAMIVKSQVCFQYPSHAWCTTICKACVRHAVTFKLTPEATDNDEHCLMAVNAHLARTLYSFLIAPLPKRKMWYKLCDTS